MGDNVEQAVYTMCDQITDGIGRWRTDGYRPIEVIRALTMTLDNFIKRHGGL